MISKTELAGLDIYNERRFSHDAERQNGGCMPVSVYNWEQLQIWQEWLKKGSLRDITVNTLHTVSGEDVPVRWLVGIIDTAQLLEGISRMGITPPEKWKLMAPLNINTTCNNGNVHKAREKAERLADFAKEYVRSFHPNLTTLPELETDSESAVATFLGHGAAITPYLPSHVQEQLKGMAGKHAKGKSIPNAEAAYFLAHYAAYGLLKNGHSEPLFPERKDVVFVVPQSEERFLGMIEDSADALDHIGMEITTFEDQGIVLMMSDALKTPHYYPHKGEPLLSGIQNLQRWPTVNQLSRNGLNGIARDEIVGALDRIDADIGGPENRQQLVEIIKNTLG